MKSLHPIKKTIPFILAAIGLSLLAACGPAEQESTTKFQVGGGSPEACAGAGSLINEQVCQFDSPGHEIITREAMELLDWILQTLYSKSFDEVMLPKDPLLQYKGSGFDSVNLLVRGNFAQDKIFPMKELDAPLRQYLWETHGAPIAEDWQDGPHRQIFHSLRDHAGTNSVESNLQTCNKMQSILKKNAAFAISGLSKSVIEKGRYVTSMNAREEATTILGATTHTLQDSFSKAHAIRVRVPGKPLVAVREFCSWGRIVPGVCLHQLSDTLDEDKVWENDVMKLEATQAANTTAFYLIHVYRAWKGKGTLDAEMSDFFEGSPRLKSELPEGLSDIETGSFDCRSL